MSNEELKNLIQLSEKAIPLYPLELRYSDNYVECPACDGNEVDASCWDTQKASSIQAFGIGVDLENTERFVEAANPTTVRAMAEELLAARAMRDSMTDGQGWTNPNQKVSNLDIEPYDAIRKKNEGEK